MRMAFGAEARRLPEQVPGKLQLPALSAPCELNSDVFAQLRTDTARSLGIWAAHVRCRR
jgi:hypothetical protein